MRMNSKTFNVFYAAFISRLTNNLRLVGVPAQSDAEKLIVKVVTGTIQEMIAEYTKEKK